MKLFSYEERTWFSNKCEGKRKKLSVHSLLKKGQKNVRISPVTIPDRATLTCEHNALRELAGRQYLRIVERPQ